MSPRAGWLLAVAAIAVGFWIWGWPGAVLGITLIVFWLLLQWSRALRMMRAAAERPVGSVPSAVMLQARLHTGMTMLQLLPITRSLGHERGRDPERWAWSDDAGDTVETEWRDGRLVAWTLQRAATVSDGPAPAAEP